MPRKAKGVTPFYRIPEYHIWRGMVRRCEGRNKRDRRLYADRGISVCDKWRHSFEAFLADIGPRPSKKHSIGRINNDGNYEPTNVRWETQAQQTRNTRRNHWLTHNGKTQTLTDWAAELGITTDLIYFRLRKELPMDQVLRGPHVMTHEQRVALGKINGAKSVAARRARGMPLRIPKGSAVPATHCQKGHAWTPENTIRQPNGTRRCRSCRKAYLAAHSRRKSRTPEEFTELLRQAGRRGGFAKAERMRARIGSAS